MTDRRGSPLLYYILYYSNCCWWGDTHARQHARARAVRKVVCAGRELRSRGWRRRAQESCRLSITEMGNYESKGKRCVSFRFISFIRCADAAAAFGTRKAIQHRTVVLLSAQRSAVVAAAATRAAATNYVVAAPKGPPSEASPK